MSLFFHRPLFTGEATVDLPLTKDTTFPKSSSLPVKRALSPVVDETAPRFKTLDSTATIIFLTLSLRGPCFSYLRYSTKVEECCVKDRQMPFTLKEKNRKYTDFKWPPFLLRACIIASPSPTPSPAAPSPPPVPSGTRQHKTRNPRSSSRGCVRMSDIIKAVSHAWIRAGCCTARTRSVPKGEKEKGKRGKRGKSAPRHERGKKRPRCRIQRGMFRIPPDLREELDFHRVQPLVEGGRVRRLGGILRRRQIWRKREREGGSQKLFLTSSFLSMWEMVDL